MKPILHYHFHKCGGTSVVDMHRKAGRTCGMLNGNPTLDQSFGVSVDADNDYLKNGARSVLLPIWKMDAELLSAWLKKGALGLACFEWRMPNPSVAIAISQVMKCAHLTAAFRDPLARARSLFNFKPGSHTTMLAWMNNKYTERPVLGNRDMLVGYYDNIYTRQLNGIFDLRPLAPSHLETAKQVIDSMAVVVVLENKNPLKLFEKLTPNINTRIHRKRSRRRLFAAGESHAFTQKFLEENAYDLEIYDYAKSIASSLQ